MKKNLEKKIIDDIAGWEAHLMTKLEAKSKWSQE